MSSIDELVGCDVIAVGERRDIPFVTFSLDAGRVLVERTLFIDSDFEVEPESAELPDGLDFARLAPLCATTVTAVERGRSAIDIQLTDGRRLRIAHDPLAPDPDRTWWLTPWTLGY